MTSRRRGPPRPLDEDSLRQLALAYVGRFATTRAKFRHYLSRKIRERGWAGDRSPDVAALADAFAEQGYIDDSGYAAAKAQSLTARGYGPRRVAAHLRRAGVEEEDAAAAHRHSQDEAVAAAVRFAQRRKIGPFSSGPAQDPRVREKALAAMVRAGHGFEIAKTILDWPADVPLDLREIAYRTRRTAA